MNQFGAPIDFAPSGLPEDNVGVIPGGRGSEKFVRGAFVAYEADGNQDLDRRRVIPFRFNPETLSRTLTVEGGQSGGGAPAGAAAAAPAPAAGTEVNGAPSGGALKESFAVQIRLDFDDRQESASGLSAEFGIAPEIAAIEDLLYPGKPKGNSDGKEAVRAGVPRPIVLFVWGKRRVLPVRIVSLKIDESLYNRFLNPVRAEIEALLEVLGEDAALDVKAVRSALDHTNKGRQRLADMYYKTTSSQREILPF